MTSVNVGKVESDLATFSLNCTFVVKDVNTALNPLGDLRRCCAWQDVTCEIDQWSRAGRVDAFLLQPLAQHFMPTPFARRELSGNSFRKYCAGLFEEDLEQRVRDRFQ